MGTARDDAPYAPVEPPGAAFAKYAGSAGCAECHAREHAAWADSHHALAERVPRGELDAAAFEPPQAFTHGSQTTRVGRAAAGAGYAIAAPGLGGGSPALSVERVIGHDPLRQYLLAGGAGRWQVSEAAWDPRSNAWFNVYGTEDRRPGEWGHWTGRGMAWNSMCATCHNTRFRKNYDEATDTYSSAMAERSVGCEACHGPMKSHVSWQQAWKGSGKKDPTLLPMSPAQHLENCGPCHARRSELTGDFVPGDSFWDHFALATVDDSRVFHADGQVWEEDYEFAPFLGSRMHAAGVTCRDCHDAHSGKTKFKGNALCLQCHNGSRPGTPIIDPIAHSFHAPNSPGSWCVDCHMPQTTYMQRHRRHDHGFTSPDPWLTQKHGVPNACNRCHTDHDAAWALAAAERWYGPRLVRPSRARADVVAKARAGDPAARPALLALVQGRDTDFWKSVAVALLEPWSTEREVREALLAQLAKPHPMLRARAIQSLAPAVESGDASARESLRGALNDPNRLVRTTAAWVLRDEVSADSRAGRELRDLLALNADQPAGQARWAGWEATAGRVDAALARFAKAIQWDPGSPALRHDYAVVLSGAGRNAEALEQTQAAARIEPGNAENQYRLGLAWHETGETLKAVAALEEALRLDPRHDRAAYNLGLAYHAVGRPEAALEALGRAESANGADPRIPYARATLLADRGQFEAARDAARRALEIRADFTAARDLLRELERR